MLAGQWAPGGRLLLATWVCSQLACVDRQAPQQATIYVPAAMTYPAYAPAYTPAYNGFQPAAGIAVTPSGTRQQPRTTCTYLGEATSCTSW